jgi:hypothetical protein
MRTALPVIALIGASAFAQSAASNSPDPERHALIEEVIAATNAKPIHDLLRTAIVTASCDGFRLSLENLKYPESVHLEPNQKQIVVNRLVEDLGKLLNEKLSWENWKPRLVQVYDATYTTEELTGVAEFFKSPAGKAFISKNPRVLEESEIAARRFADGFNMEFSQNLPDLIRSIFIENGIPLR